MVRRGEGAHMVGVQAHAEPVGERPAAELVMYWEPERLPPGPSWPKAAQTALWAARPLTMMRHCRRRYGDVFTVRLYGFGDMVVVGDPAGIKDMFARNREAFHAGEANEALAPSLGRQSVMVLDGERHIQQRRRMLPPFHGEAVKRYRERIEEIASEQVTTWPSDTPMPIRPRMEAITFEAILHALLGGSDPSRLERLGELFHQLLDFGVLDMWALWLFPKLLDSPVGRRHPTMRARAEIQELLRQEVAAHRAGARAAADILALLADSDAEVDDEQVADQIVSLVIAGHDTTTTGLAWTCERLVRHPAVLARLRDEVDAGREEYLEAVIKETLRARPVLYGCWRKLAASTVVAGHRLPKGTLVYAAFPLVHTSTAYTRADEFRPERFLNGSPAAYSFIPFGGGTRRCVGASFALMEMKAVLSTMLRTVDLHPTDLRPEAPRVHNVTLRPQHGGRVKVTARGG